MISARILVLFLVLALLSGCDNRETKEANDLAAKVFRAWDDYTDELSRRYEKAEMPEMPELPEMPNLVPESVSKAVDEHTDKIAEKAGAAAAEHATKQVAKQVGSEIDDVKQTAGQVSDSASATAKSAKRHVRHYLRRVPKSQREANDLVVEKGRSWGDELNRWLQELGANGGIFGRRSSKPSSYSRSPKSRLKGRSTSASNTPERLRR